MEYKCNRAMDGLNWHVSLFVENHKCLCREKGKVLKDGRDMKLKKNGGEGDFYEVLLL